MSGAAAELMRGFKDSFKALLYPDGVTCSLCGTELSSGVAAAHAKSAGTNKPAGAADLNVNLSAYQDIVSRADICEKCYYENLAFIGKACKKCGSGIDSGDICIRCKAYPMSFERTVAVCEYDSFTVSVLFKLKNGQKHISREVACLMAERLKAQLKCEELGEIDILTAVPCSSKVLKARGYNQSALLCGHISRALSLPEDCRSLVKVTDTSSQKKLTAKERESNLKKSFKVNDKSAFKDKTVLLVDDVITTGATLSNAAETLIGSGAKKVLAVTFASVRYEISAEGR